MKIKLTLVYIFAMTVPALSQQELSLESAIQTALENNYNIKIARSEEEISKNNVTRGNAGFLPSLVADYDINYGVQTFEQASGSGEIRSQKGAQSNRKSYGARLDWTIFDGFQMFTRYDQLQLLKEQRSDAFRAEVELLVYNLSSAFYSAALEKERLALYASNVGLSEERLEVAQNKYELGKASKLEKLQAQVDLNADKSSMIQQLELLAERKFELVRLMGLKNDSIDFTLSYQLYNDPSMDLEKLLTKVEAQNSDLLALRKASEIARYNTKTIAGERMPEVGLFADYTHSNSENPAGFFIRGQSDNLTYGLSARWTLFNGLNTNRRLQNAKIQQQIVRYQYEDQRLSYTTNIKTRYINYRNNLNLLQMEEENLSVARENNEIAQERYDIGLSNPVELREAQLNLINAEIRRQDAAFAAKQAEIALKYLSGTLVE